MIYAFHNIVRILLDENSEFVIEMDEKESS